MSSSEIEEITTLALQGLDAIQEPSDLEEWRLSFLGRRGALTQILRNLGSMQPSDRQKVGASANQAKTLLVQRLKDKEKALHEVTLSEKLDTETIDVTLPGWPSSDGGLHPTTQTLREICAIFTSMGFQIMEGPEVEWDHYNFEMLNIPKHHPARDMFNSFWIDYTDARGEHPMVLRTHTSPMQARIMEKTAPPIRVVVPGKSFRYEATDPTHEWHFFQIEGLAVDQGITFANMKGTLFEFARRLFGEERRVRFRCDYFPFVEPGVDMSIDCFACSGDGCRICSNTGWIEIMGAGMVHPNVLTAVGYDPSIYTGFACGMGVERIAMLKYGINDIRQFYSNDLRFLKQF